MGHDPFQPGYVPEFTGETKFGDVGSGGDFGAHLYVLYAAGRVHLPEVAATYDGLTSSLHELGPLMARCAETVPGGLDRILTGREDLQAAFRRTALHLEDAAEALVVIANDYARTDEEAATAFKDGLTLLSTPEERDKLDQPAPPPVDPPGLNSPQPELEASPHGPMPVPGEL